MPLPLKSKTVSETTQRSSKPVCFGNFFVEILAGGMDFFVGLPIQMEHKDFEPESVIYIFIYSLSCWNAITRRHNPVLWSACPKSGKSDGCVSKGIQHKPSPKLIIQSTNRTVEEPSEEVNGCSWGVHEGGWCRQGGTEDKVRWRRMIHCDNS